MLLLAAGSPDSRDPDKRCLLRSYKMTICPNTGTAIRADFMIQSRCHITKVDVKQAVLDNTHRGLGKTLLMRKPGPVNSHSLQRHRHGEVVYWNKLVVRKEVPAMRVQALLQGNMLGSSLQLTFAKRTTPLAGHRRHGRQRRRGVQR